MPAELLEPDLGVTLQLARHDDPGHRVRAGVLETAPVTESKEAVEVADWDYSKAANLVAVACFHP